LAVPASAEDGISEIALQGDCDLWFPHKNTDCALLQGATADGTVRMLRALYEEKFTGKERGFER